MNGTARRRGPPASETDRLASEASQMASKLDALRAQMSREKEKREAAPSGKWQSARGDRGSTRQYGREVRERELREREKRGKGQPPADAASVAAAPRQAPGDAFSTTPVVQWTVGCTVSWLESIGLAQYRPAFESNEIAGQVLLDLGLDDLDYLEVKVLAHRKQLLTGIAALSSASASGRRASPGSEAPSEAAQRSPRRVRTTRTPPRPPASGLGAWEALPPSPPTGPRVSGQAVAREPAMVQHWSTLEPLADRARGAGADAPANAADAARGQPLAAAGGSSAWDPNAAAGFDGPASSLLGGDFDEEAERAEFQRAVNAWRTGGADDDAPAPQAPQLAANETLLVGDLDEAAERDAFQRAVSQWRGGDEAPAAAAPRRSAARPHPSEGVGGAQVKSSKEVAEELARQLDELHSIEADALAQKKEAAALRLHEAMRAQESASVDDDGDYDSKDDSKDDTRQRFACPNDELEMFEGDSDDDSDDDVVLESTAHIALLESQLGCSTDDLAEYTVDEEEE
ncbi:hypothetical protein M885DRAFT_506619 [Pelagophyceae sp. CCMP2097]|nr:hypothetical protein M885DRAFT_506619 [Pelagophyceae sp. CCMP2097]